MVTDHHLLVVCSVDANVQRVLRGCCPRVTISTTCNVENHRDERKSTTPSVRGTDQHFPRLGNTVLFSAQSTSRVFVHVTGPRTAAKKQRNTNSRRTYCVRSVDVPGLNRNLCTHRTSLQKAIQPLGDGHDSQSVARKPDGSGHTLNRLS